MIRYLIVFFATWFVVSYSLQTLTVSAENSNSIGLILASLCTLYEIHYQRKIRKFLDERD
ncbi:hypothetical protein D5P86_00760 [Salmonella enterica subsp. enterica serovar Infantis]|nr:hypothetical protein [Salmonella enterica subsp. enterica serovar Infantis]